MTDPDQNPTRDAHVDMIAEQVEQHDDQDRDHPVDQVTMARDCHQCGAALSPTTGIQMGGWKATGGVCQSCRHDGVGGAVFVTVDPDAIRDGKQKRLRQKARNGHAQKPLTAARFLDRTVPAGTYAVRRADAYVLEVTWQDGALTDAQRTALAEHFREHGSQWFVQSFPGAIRLVDRQMAEPDPDAQPTTVRGP